MREMSNGDFKKLEKSHTDIQEEQEEAKENLKLAYKNIIDILKEYIDLKEEYYNIISLWIIGTYVHDSFRSFPYLYFNAMKGSGKTRTISLITCLAKDGSVQNSMTEAVLFRTKGTLAIDEFEGVSRKGQENLRELLNSAYKKGIMVKRMKQVKTDEGTEQVVEEFEVYRPIVLANIWGMENVTGDRCIQLNLERSANRKITNLMELWDDEKIVIETKKLLDLVSFVSMSFLVRRSLEWNNYVKQGARNNTNYTNNTNNTNYTNDTNPFEIINSMGLSGRETELSFPLCMLATEISEEILKETTLTLKTLFESKREDEKVENIDISLYDFVSQYTETEWVSVSQILKDFKEFLDSNDEWINTKWLGRALKRLVLVKEKKRMGRGRYIILDIEKAQKKMEIFK